VRPPRLVVAGLAAALVAVATLVPAAAGPVDEAIAAVRVQIAEVEEAIVGVASTIVRVKEAIVGVEAAIVGAESAISGLEAAIVAEGGRIVAYHGDLEAVDVAIAEIEARIVTQDEGMLVYPVRLELLADEYIEVWASRAGPFRLRRELAVDSYVRNDERMNSVLTQSAQLTDKALEGIRSRILYDALIEETDERLKIVDARMRIAGDRVAGVHTEISLAKDRQAASFRELEDTRASIEVADAKIVASGSEIERFHGEIEQQRGEIERLDGEIVLHQEEIVRLEGEIVRLEGEIKLIQELPPTRRWSGLEGDEIRRPALAVKIDNVSVARPQEGINQADVVYEELVEAGLTRLVAVFQTTGARSVGPIRSARTSDPPLLEGFDRPLFAYSGANRGTRRAVAASQLTDIGYDTASSLYWRSTSRRAPHNLFSATDRLWGKYPERDEIPTAPFAFRTVLDELHPSAEPVAGVFVDFGHAEIDYAWNGEGWERTHNGEAHSDSDGVRVAPSNVVIQFTTYGTSSADSRSPEAQTIGSGEVWVFTDGHVVRGRWERPDPSRPATLVADGRPIRLTPGRTWVALARPGTAEIR